VSKFLLVDDNHINLKVLSTYMKKLHIEYDTAKNGKEAVDLFCLIYRKYTCVTVFLYYNHPYVVIYNPGPLA
jgi:DNA-binding response OmpR family regulator